MSAKQTPFKSIHSMSTSSHSEAPVNDDWDFVVVGGGTTGLVVAARLTEDSQTRVLVLEAGNDHSTDPRVNVPALWPSVLKSDVDWAFETTPQVSDILQSL